MHADYPKKLPISYWDTLNIEFPIRKFPNTDTSGETIARGWRNIPEVLKSGREPIEELRSYLRDYNITKELTQSQSTKDFGYKPADTIRHNKHTSSSQNQYIYPPCRKLEDQPPQCSAHGSTEMKNSYKTPAMQPRLVTDKDQYKHPICLPDQHCIEPSFHKELEPLDTTHEGYEKYLDPYLTTSRLYHRPFTADQLSKSASKNIETYYTLGDTVWVRKPRLKTEDYCLPLLLHRPKSMYDREKFKQDFREIRTHNNPRWLPGTFRTECRDNYTPPSSNIGDFDREVRTYYIRTTAQLPANISSEISTMQHCYKTENSVIGSREPVCSIIDQHVEKNKRLENMSARCARARFKAK